MRRPLQFSLRILAALAVAGVLHAEQAAAQTQASSNGSSGKAVQATDSGELINGVYRNASFGFSYRVPYSWVDRTQDMREDSGETGKAMVLLAVFQRPPQAVGVTVNSAVVIAAESVASYPGLKSAAQYFGPLSDLTAAKGFKPVNEPYEFPVDGKPIVRRDFIKSFGGVGMHQSTLALLARGYVLSYTFIGSSDDEVTSLIEGLRLGPMGKVPKNPAAPPGR